MTLSTAFAALTAYLAEEGETPEGQAEIIYDAVIDGAKLLNPTTSRLMMDFVAAIPGPEDDIYDTDIVKALETIDTDNARLVAEELRRIIAQPF